MLWLIPARNFTSSDLSRRLRQGFLRLRQEDYPWRSLGFFSLQFFTKTKTYYEGERVKCHACGRMDKHVKVGQLGRIGNIIANRAPLNNSCNSTKLIQPWQFHWGQFLNLTTFGRCTNVHILGWDVWLKVFCNTKPPSSVIFVGTQCFSQVSWCGASGVWR